MTVLVIAPREAPKTIEITGDLGEMQSIVGGSIEDLYPFPERIALICNEEGKLRGLPLNRCLKDDLGVGSLIIRGTFFLCGLTAEGDDFAGLTPAQTAHFTDLFRVPEMFVRLGDKIICLPLREEPRCWYRPKSNQDGTHQDKAIYIVFPSDTDEKPVMFDTYNAAKRYGDKHFGSGKYTIESPI